MTSPAEWIGKRPVRTLLLVIGGSVLLDMVFFTGFLASDDLLYYSAAVRLAETGHLWAQPQPGEVRLLMIAWCLTVNAAVGGHVQLVAASFVLFHQALNLLTWSFGRRLFGPGAGLLAAYLVATFPANVVFSTTILPDLPVAVSITAAFVLFLHAYDVRRDRGLGPSLPRMATVGLALGVGYLAKESALIAAPFFAAYVVVRELRRSRRRAWWTAPALIGALASGLAVPFLFEWLLLERLTGHFFFRIGWGAPSFRMASFDTWPDRWAALLAVIGGHGSSIGGSILLAGVVVLLVVPRRAWPALLLAGFYVGYYALGSASATRYVAPVIQERYLLPAVPLLALVAAASVVRAGRVLCSLPWPRPTAARELRAAAIGVAILLPLVVLIPRATVRAGQEYGSVLAGNARRAVAHWSMFGREPLVLSSALAAHVHPLFDGGSRPSDLLYSQELGAASLARLEDGGGFYFAEIARRSWLFRDSDNPILGWKYSLLPTGPALPDRLVHDAAWRHLPRSGWVVREVGRFHGFRSRLGELAAVLGRAVTPEQLRRDTDQTVVLYRCVPESRDGLLAYRLPDVAPADLPAPRNAGFDVWSGGSLAGWQVVGGPVRRAVGARGRTRATLGACDFCYLWQSLEAGPTLAGRSLELSARVLATRGGNSRLWIKADLGRGEWDESFSEWHPGDGRWHRLAVWLPLPLSFRGGELRIALQHWNDRTSATEFEALALEVRD